MDQIFECESKGLKHGKIINNYNDEYYVIKKERKWKGVMSWLFSSLIIITGSAIGLFRTCVKWTWWPGQRNLCDVIEVSSYFVSAHFQWHCRCWFCWIYCEVGKVPLLFFFFCLDVKGKVRLYCLMYEHNHFKNGVLKSYFCFPNRV